MCECRRYGNEVNGIPKEELAAQMMKKIEVLEELIEQSEELIDKLHENLGDLFTNKEQAVFNPYILTSSGLRDCDDDVDDVDDVEDDDVDDVEDLILISELEVTLEQLQDIRKFTLDDKICEWLNTVEELLEKYSCEVLDRME